MAVSPLFVGGCGAGTSHPSPMPHKKSRLHPSRARDRWETFAAGGNRDDADDVGAGGDDALPSCISLTEINVAVHSSLTLRHGTPTSATPDEGTAEARAFARGRGVADDRRVRGGLAGDHQEAPPPELVGRQRRLLVHIPLAQGQRTQPPRNFCLRSGAAAV